MNFSCCSECSEPFLFTQITNVIAFAKIEIKKWKQLKFASIIKLTMIRLVLQWKLSSKFQIFFKVFLKQFE